MSWNKPSWPAILRQKQSREAQLAILTAQNYATDFVEAWGRVEVADRSIFAGYIDHWLGLDNVTMDQIHYKTAAVKVAPYCYFVLVVVHTNADRRNYSLGASPYYLY